MENRPDKPGCYWWEDDCSRYHVVEFDEDMEAFETGDYGDYGYTNPEEIENFPCFFRWVGPAHPPKKVRRIKVDVYRELLSGYRHTVDVYYGIKEDDHGDLVKYDDVKEYLLDGDDDAE